MLAMIIELSAGAGNIDWFLYLAPFMSIALVFYGREFKNLLFFETIGAASVTLYNFIVYRTANPKWASNMLIGKLLKFPEITDTDAFVAQTQSTNQNAAEVLNAIKYKSGGLFELVNSAAVITGSIYVVCIITFILLCRQKNIGNIELNVRPYSLTRLLINMFICFIPIFGFIYLRIAYL